MNDLELKSLLAEICPVLPGQEARAWTLLQGRMTVPSSNPWFTWRSMASCGVGVAALVLIASYFSSPVTASVSTASQSPGIFASAFYSQPAHAQVVWLNGMEPATDGPTYMDRSGKIDEKAAQPVPPDSL